MEAPESVAEVPPFTFKKRNPKAKSALRKRAATPPPGSDSDSGFTSSEDESGRQIKRRRNNAGVTASSAAATVHRPVDESGPEGVTTGAIPDYSNNATRASNWYDEKEQSRSSPSKPPPDAEAADGTYKGVSSYQSFIQKNPERISKTVGPQKAASSNVRTITITDFAPDVCKDYKQTGFCGFGDSCKFLHAREDYKQGWALDKEWEINTKGKAVGGKTVASANRHAKGEADKDDEDEAMLESIPFACVICKAPYQNPIVTKCGHYFCESCALKRYRKDPSCAQCGASTGGVFNVAKKLSKLLERKKERAEKMQETGEDEQAVDTSKWR